MYGRPMFLQYVKVNRRKRTVTVTMAQWQLEPKPKAEMTAVDPKPVDRGDGATVQRWKTNTGVVHAQVVFPTGRVEWYLLVQA